MLLESHSNINTAGSDALIRTTIENDNEATKRCTQCFDALRFACNETRVVRKLTQTRSIYLMVISYLFQLDLRDFHRGENVEPVSM